MATPMAAPMDPQVMLAFLARSTLEDRLFFVFEGTTRRWELNWEDDGNMRHWALRHRDLRDVGDEFKYSGRLTPAQVVSHLREDNVPETNITAELQCVVWQQIAFAKSVLDDATRNFGRNSVDDACASVEEFCDQVRTVVDKVLSDKSDDRQPPHLRLI